jgi:hypothetical protein
MAVRDAVVAAAAVVFRAASDPRRAWIDVRAGMLCRSRGAAAAMLGDVDPTALEPL